MLQSTIRRYFKHGMLPQLRVFEAVARHGNFTRAAQELCLAQPTVSVQIRKLTETVGMPLFEQVGKQTHPTAAGHELYAACREMFETFAGFDETLSNLREPKGGMLRLAASTARGGTASRNGTMLKLAFPRPGAAASAPAIMTGSAHALERSMPDSPGTTAAGSALLLRRDAGGVATLTLNRPQQFNALSSALLIELDAALDAIAHDESVRVVVLAGAGKAFCSGHDLKELRAHPDGAFARRVFERCAGMMLKLTRLPQPVIARVHGFAFAAGCQLVAQCDLAVASTDAQLATSGVKFGLFCNTPGVALARNVSRKHAMEMLLTGEPIDAQTALARGLVNRVVAPDRLDEEISGLARSIIAKTPVAVAAGKRAFYEQVEVGLERAYELASEAMLCNLMTEDAAEGIDAFTQKRAPSWKGK